MKQTGEHVELVAPAGNLDKLQYAYHYGADAAYIGLKKFSLRVKADNFYENEYEQIIRLKKQYPHKRLFCALNITFHNDEIDAFLSEINYFKQYPFDAFIIQDIGMVDIIQKHFPDCALHLSTQANCINREAVKVYRTMGFKRIVLGREASLHEIRRIKDAVPDMELEAFVHGAMCIAYSGRCLMSAYMTGRSGNSGHCTHSCRWNYALTDFALQEKERPNELFPVIADENFTAILSSKDLCMIDHLDDMKSAGIDSLKIEGRMKSIYYVALITRAYRKAIDVQNGSLSTEAARPFIDELYNTAHREFATGFYYSRNDANQTTIGMTDSSYTLVGTIGCEVPPPENYIAQLDTDNTDVLLTATNTCHKHYRFFEFISMNKIDSGIPLEYVGPDIISIEDTDYILIQARTGEKMNWVCHGHPCIICTSQSIASGYIVRSKVENMVDTKNSLSRAES